MRWTVLVVVVSVLACVSPDPAPLLVPLPETVPDSGPALTEATPPSTVPPKADPEIRYLTDADDHRPTLPPGLTFRSCRSLGFGRYVFEVIWDPPTGDPEPVTIPLVIGFFQGDLGVGWPTEITLPGPGPHSLDIDQHRAEATRRHPLRGTWSAGRGERGFHSCVLGGSGEYQAVELIFDPQPAPADVPDGGLEEMLAGIRPDDLSHPLLPLGHLLAAPDLPPIDHYYLLPGRLLSSVTVERTGSCIVVDSHYGEDPEQWVTVFQRYGCPHGHDPDRTTIDVDNSHEHWEVTVSSESLDVSAAAAAALVVAPLVTNPALAPDGFDADSMIDALLLDREGAEEIARFDWMEGRVAVIQGAESNCCESYADPVVVPATWFNPGGTGRDCRDHSVVALSDGVRGLVLVVVQDPAYRVVFTSESGPVEVRLVAARGGRAAGLLDLPGPTPADLFTRVSIRDASGAEVTCVQG